MRLFAHYINGMSTDNWDIQRQCIEDVIKHVEFVVFTVCSLSE